MAGLIGCANYGHNQELMEKCPLLGEYAHFVSVSREYLAQGMERQEAYEAAIDYCIEHDILKKFLRENRMEVIGMLLREFDVEKYERSIREEGREEVRYQGSLSALNDLVKDGILTLSEAARRVAMTEEDYIEQIEKIGL